MADLLSIYLLRSLFPKMYTRELVDRIRSAALQSSSCGSRSVFAGRRALAVRHASGAASFRKFLQTSETIRTVTCGSHNTKELDISPDEWVLLIKTFGRIRDIQNIAWLGMIGSRDSHPFQAVAEALNNARSLRKLTLVPCLELLPTDPSELSALANGFLREHTSLQE